MTFFLLELAPSHTILGLSGSLILVVFYHLPFSWKLKLWISILLLRILKTLEVVPSCFRYYNIQTNNYYKSCIYGSEIILGDFSNWSSSFAVEVSSVFPYIQSM